jgi:hypothetical protein
MVTVLATTLLLSTFTVDKASFSESYRHESLTQSDFNSSSTTSASRSKFNLNIDLAGDTSTLTPDSVLEFKFNNYTFRQPLSSDKKWKPGSTKAKLAQYFGGDNGVQYLDGSADVSWTKQKVTIKFNIERDVFASKFVSSTKESSINGKVPLAFSFAGNSLTEELIVTGKAKTVTKGNDSVSGTVQTVEIKGTR